jgi:hypothetical protein
VPQRGERERKHGDLAACADLNHMPPGRRGGFATERKLRLLPPSEQPIKNLPGSHRKTGEWLLPPLRSCVWPELSLAQIVSSLY